MDKAIKSSDEALADRITQIENMVDRFAREGAVAAEELVKQAQAIALTLPFSRGDPQVTTWQPRFFVPSQDITFTVTGIFTQAQREGMAPTLTIGDRQISVGPGMPGTSLTQELQFIVPSNILPAPTGAAATPITASLTVPYRSPVLQRHKTATFSVLLGVMPPSAGTVEIRRVRHDVSTEQLRKSTGVIAQGGRDDSEALEYCTEPASPPWRFVVPSNVDDIFKLDDLTRYSRENVNWSKRWVNVGATDRACVMVWTCGRDECGHSGDINFHVEWTIARDVDHPTWVTESPVNLAWGEMRTFDVVNGEWRLVYDPFDGPPQELVSAVELPYISLREEQGVVSLQVKTFCKRAPGAEPPCIML
ncbi:hypothetical protein ACI784_09395 [Geodermatophilus sp. SYSU D01186]